MATKIFTILLVLIGLSLGICSADGLPINYKDKHNIYRGEAERNYCHIDWYDKTLNELDYLNSESSNLEFNYRSNNIRAVQYYRDQLKINNDIYVKLIAARDYYNFINNTNRSDFSVDDIKSEIERLTYRNHHLEKELLRLKFSIIGRYSSLPEWWGARPNEMLEITANNTRPREQVR